GAPDVTRTDHRVGQDHALQPARTAEDHVDRHAERILDLQFVLDPRGEGGNEVRACAAGAHIAKVVGDDDVVERFAIDARGLQRLPRGVEGDVGGHEVLGDV